MEKSGRYGWLIIIRGLIAMAFGLMALAWPGVTIEVLVLWFGIYALMDGIFGVISSFQAAGHHQKWWFLLLEGLLGIFVGIYAFTAPGQTALILTIFIGAWAIVTGIFEMAAAFTGPWGSGAKWTLGIAGFFSILVGSLLFWNPIAGAVSIVILIGAYAVAFGILLMILGFNVKSVKN